MLFIVFHLNEDRYALDASQLIEILPLVDVRNLPQAPDGVAGVLDFRGVPLPVIDLTAMALGRASGKRVSTRTLVVELPNGRRLALIAERANELLKKEPTDFSEMGITPGTAPFLGPVTRDDRGFIQWVQPEQLLTPEISEALSARKAA